MFTSQGCVSCPCLSWRRRWRKSRRRSAATAKSWSRLWPCEMNWTMKRRYLNELSVFSTNRLILLFLVTWNMFLNPGEEQLHLAADRRAEQAEGAPGAAAEKEENQKHDDNRTQRPENDEHAHPGNGESRRHRKRKDEQVFLWRVMITTRDLAGCWLLSNIAALWWTFFLSSINRSLLICLLSFCLLPLLLVAPHSGGTLQCHSQWPPSNFWHHRRGQTGAPALSSDLLLFLFLHFCLRLSCRPLTFGFCWIICLHLIVCSLFGVNF